MPEKTSPPTSTQLLVIDIDGTLFNSQQQVSDANIKAIQKARASGMTIALASGRGRPGINEVLRLTNLDLPYICSAGAGVFNGARGHALDLELIPADDDLFGVLSETATHNIGWIMDLPDGFCWLGDDKLIASMDPFSRSGMRMEDRISSFDELLAQQILKISFFAPPQIRETAMTIFPKYGSYETVYAGLNYIDLTMKGVNKGSALVKLAAALGVPMARVAAIGDQEIDVSMFQKAGISIAMANAPDEIQKKADIISPSNDDDGVAWAIERLMKE